MQKIYFDHSTFIWKQNLKSHFRKERLLGEALRVIESLKDKVTHDGFGYFQEDKDINFLGEIRINNEMDLVCQAGINACKKIHETERNLPYNKVNTDAWVNVVRSVNPVQFQFNPEKYKISDKFHNHVEINKNKKGFFPDYTYVYYIQMPDVMEGEDGVLYFRGESDKEYYIKPEEGDLIIMLGSTPHAPNNAPKSNVDRIVMAGNVGFEFIKKEKSLL
jgi:hypothetical protein